MKNKNEIVKELLLNPFTRIAGWNSFLIGIVIVAVTVVIGYYSNTCYYGVLDIKFGKNLSLVDSFLFQAVGLLGTALFTYLVSIIFAKHVRVQDVLGTTILARFPLIFTAFLGFMTTAVDGQKLLDSIVNNTIDYPQLLSLIIVSLLIIPFVIWYLIVLYNAFKISTGLKNKLLLFILIIVLSEISSTTILFLILDYKLI